jgi:hypothetical protein
LSVRFRDFDGMLRGRMNLERLRAGARAPNGEESNWRIELILDHAHPQRGFQEPEHPISAVAGVPCGFEAWSEILGSLEGRRF